MIRLALCFAFALACTPVRAEILVAVAGPMSGPYSSLGALMRAGAQQAVEDINAAGGVNGETLVLEVLDDACDSTRATAVANQIAGKGAKLVAGHLCSSTSIPASAVYAQHGIIQISPASTNPKYTDERPGEKTFRIFGRDDQQGQIAGRFLAARFAGSKIAIVHDKTAYGKGLADQTKKYMNEAGVQEVLYKDYSAGEKDYTELVSMLKSESVDVLYVGGYHTEAGLIVRQMREQGMSAVLVSGDALVTDEYWAIAGEAANGTLVTFPPDARRNPQATVVVERFRSNNIEPESYVLPTYAAIQAWVQAAAAAGSTDSDMVAAALAQGIYDTVLGQLSFNGKGDANLPSFAVFEWKAGKLEEVD